MDTKVVLDFLRNQQPFEFNGGNHYSNLVAGIKTCRDATKRDSNTGKVPDGITEGGPENWLGAIGYFSILDLIGSTFKKKSDRAFAPNSIEYAVNTFALDLIDFDSQKASALYALRCAFAHDFNLLNVNEKKLHLQHKFNVYAEPTQNIVTMPKEPWDGKIASKSFKDLSNVTFVNLWAFGDMVEEIFVRVIDGISDGTLEIQMDTPTLINKYTFMMFQSQALFDVN